jgi:hypothetical protein
MTPIKKVLQAVKWFFLNPRCLFWLGMTITLLATTIEVVRGRNTNYFDYQDSTRMFWEGLTPYTLEFAQAHSLYFLYLPVFCVLFAPIFLLPWWLGPYIWNIGNFVLFSLAIWMLPKLLAPHRHAEPSRCRLPPRDVRRSKGNSRRLQEDTVES